MSSVNTAKLPVFARWKPPAQSDCPIRRNARLVLPGHIPSRIALITDRVWVAPLMRWHIVWRTQWPPIEQRPQFNAAPNYCQIVNSTPVFFASTWIVPANCLYYCNWCVRLGLLHKIMSLINFNMALVSQCGYIWEVGTAEGERESGCR